MLLLLLLLLGVLLQLALKARELRDGLLEELQQQGLSADAAASRAADIFSAALALTRCSATKPEAGKNFFSWLQGTCSKTCNSSRSNSGSSSCCCCHSCCRQHLLVMSLSSAPSVWGWLWYLSVLLLLLLLLLLLSVSPLVLLLSVVAAAVALGLYARGYFAAAGAALWKR